MGLAVPRHQFALQGAQQFVPDGPAYERKSTIDARDAVQAVIAGHDWGGLLVWPFVRRYPHLVAGAVHLSKGIIERDIETQAPDKNATLVLYCGGGYRSALAADNLQKMGYTNVISMDGGFRGWKEAGLSIQKG